MWKTLKKLSTVFLTIILADFFNIDAEREMTLVESILLSCGICLVLTVILASFSYFFKKFYISDGNLVVTHGLIDRENTSIPLDKVHSLRTQKGILYRLFDMRGIVFDTLASRQEEVELILSDADWKQLLDIIEKEDRKQYETSSSHPTVTPTTVVLPTTRLLLAALCQNHLKGMAVLGSLFAIIFSNLSDLPDATTHRMTLWLENFFGSVSYTLPGILLTFAAGYLMILFFLLGRILFRYADMIMSYDRRLITFTYGLFSRNSSRFFHDKICTIWIKRNFLERKFGFSTIMLRQALFASAEKEEDRIKIYGSDSSGFFLDWWIGAGKASTPDFLAAKSGKGVLIISILPPLLLTILAVIILCHYNLFIWLIFPLVYLIVSIFKGILKMRHSQIHLKPECILINCGSFAFISNYLKYGNVEVIGLHRSPLSRFTGRLTLIISTSGTTFRLRSLPEAEALLIYDAILAKASGQYF
ncbi:MAG: PH domain-containing protein [Muribaculaceae bacterium]|nr:PH domain-containing protein [Muribaculaceae bacterium]